VQAQPTAAGAYAGVRVETHDGAHLRDYDLPWSRQRLLGINYLPIHAVLFRTDRVRENALRFDESLPVLEDWQFWVQLTDGADLVHCPGVSAVYRQGLGQSALGDANHPHHWRIWHQQLLLQWLKRASQDQLAEALAWHALELDRIQTDVAQRAEELRAVSVRWEQAQSEVLNAQTLALQEASARQSLQRQLEAFSQESQAALDLKESTLQFQAAQAAQQLAEREAEAQRFAAEAQRELSALQARLQSFGLEVRQTLDAKEAELQRLAAETQRALQARDAERQALEQRLQHQLDDLKAQLLSRESELAAVHASRSWRWTAPLRRGSRSSGRTGS
jgi:hypothetical protein